MNSQSSHFVPFLSHAFKIGRFVWGLQDLQHARRKDFIDAWLASGSAGPTGVEQGTPSRMAKLISVCQDWSSFVTPCPEQDKNDFRALRTG